MVPCALVHGTAAGEAGYGPRRARGAGKGMRWWWPPHALRSTSGRATQPKASIDALHIAMVAHHRIQYLLTWNRRHIANAKILPRIHEVLTDLGNPIPIICTPEEMVDDDSQEE